MNELYIEEPAKWKKRILRQIHTAVPVGMILNNLDTEIVHTTEIEPISNLEDDLKIFCSIV